MSVRESLGGEKTYFVLGAILIWLAIGIYVYPQMPERMAFLENLGVQFEFGSDVAAKSLFLFMPSVFLGMFLLYLVTKKFSGFVRIFVWVLFWLIVIIVAWHLGIPLKYEPD